MYKDVLTHMNVTWCAEAGLVIFVLVFIGSTLWALTRKRNAVQEWSTLPLDDAQSVLIPVEKNRHE